MTVDIERIALSNQLFDLSESFELEASLWLDGDRRETLARGARLLAEIARNTLGHRADLEVADAYVTAGIKIVSEVARARRFLTGIDTLPTVAAVNR